MPDWMAVGIRLDDDRVGIVVPATVRRLDIDHETEDYTSLGSPVFKPLLSRVIFTVTMDEYRMVHADTYADAMAHLPELSEILTPDRPRTDLTAAMHTLFHLAGEHVTTKEQAAALERVAEFLGY